MLTRLFFLLIMLAGGGVGIVLPFVAASMAGYEIGRWEVYDRDSGFSEAQASLAPADAPVFSTIEIVTEGPLRAPDRTAYMTVVVRNGAGTEQVAVLDLSGVEPTITSPQSAEVIYRVPLEPLRSVVSDTYVFAFTEGDVALGQLLRATLIVKTGAFDLDPRIVPAAYILLAIGAVGLLLTFRRPPERPTPQPVSPKWGRNAGRDDQD